ncbi:MAG TPA: DUF4166 domain-containing protein [Rhodobacteraceae bacterium]|nr:DUF4166 domain-containing protein [Paracoccaceae bacterium]
MGVFIQALGESFHSLPAAVQAFHSAGNRRYAGLADITRSRSPYGALILKLAGFPPAGSAVPVTVIVKETATAELWTRDFSGHFTRSSIRFTGTAGIIEERLGPLTLRMRLTASPKGLHYGILSASIFGLKAPRFLLPKSDTWETADSAGNFHFSVTATAFLAGRIIHYQGSLAPQ